MTRRSALLFWFSMQSLAAGGIALAWMDFDACRQAGIDLGMARVFVGMANMLFGVCATMSFHAIRGSKL